MSTTTDPSSEFYGFEFVGNLTHQDAVAQERVANAQGCRVKRLPDLIYIDDSGKGAFHNGSSLQAFFRRRLRDYPDTD